MRPRRGKPAEASHHRPDHACWAGLADSREPASSRCPLSAGRHDLECRWCPGHRLGSHWSRRCQEPRARRAAVAATTVSITNRVRLVTDIARPSQAIRMAATCSLALESSREPITRNPSSASETRLGAGSGKAFGRRQRVVHVGCRHHTLRGPRKPRIGRSDQDAHSPTIGNPAARGRLPGGAPQVPTPRTTMRTTPDRCFPIHIAGDGEHSDPVLHSLGGGDRRTTGDRGFDDDHRPAQTANHAVPKREP